MGYKQESHRNPQCDQHFITTYRYARRSRHVGQFAKKAPKHPSSISRQRMVDWNPSVRNNAFCLATSQGVWHTPDLQRWPA